VGHAFGPDSHEVRDMTLRTDRQLASILAHLDEIAGPGRYHVIVSSDHGVGTIPEVAARRGLPAGRVSLLRLKLAIERALREEHGPAPEGEHWYGAIGDGGVMLNRRLLEQRGIPLAHAQDVAARAAATLDGIAEAIPAHAVAEGTLPPGPVHDTVRKCFYGGRSGDVLVIVKPNHLFGATVASHGTPYDYDRRVPLFLSGPGIRAGYRGRDPVTPGSAVVTVAEALGIAPPSRAVFPALRAALDRE
jgi:hypothetical protein